MLSLQTPGSFGVCRIPTATGSSDSRGDTAVTPPSPPCPSPVPGCFDPRCHHPAVTVDPVPPVTHPRPSQGHLGHRRACHGGPGLAQRTGWHYCVKNPSWPLGMMLFWARSPQPSWPRGAPQGLPKPSGSWCSASPRWDLAFPWGFSFSGAMEEFLSQDSGGKASVGSAKLPRAAATRGTVWDVARAQDLVQG